jgi:hypothetical protein
MKPWFAQQRAHQEQPSQITQLSDTAEAAIIHPVHDESRGWTWRPEPL